MEIHATPFLVIFLVLIFIVALSSTVSIAQSGATGFSSARLSTGGKELIVYETEPTNPFNDLKVFQKGAKVKMIANNLVCKEFNDILYYMNIEGALYGDVYTAFSGISISKGSCAAIRTNNKADAVYNFMGEGCIAKRNAFLNSQSSKIRTCDTTENRPFNVQAEANLPEVEGTYCIAAGCEVAFRVYDGTAEFRQVEMTVQIKDLGNASQLEKASTQTNGVACGKGTKCPLYKNICIWNNPSGPGLCSSEQITSTTSTTVEGRQETTTTLTQTKEAHKSWQAHSSGSVVHKISWSPDGKKIASTDTYEIKIWDPAGVLTNSFKIVKDGYAAGGWGLSWSPDGRKIASILSSSESGGIYPSPHVAIYDSTTGTELKRIKLGEGGVVSYALDWSPDGKKIAAALDGSVVILDSDRGDFLATLSEGHAGIAYYLAWSRDGKKIASTFVSQNTAVPNSLNIWDADSGNLIKRVATENDIWVRGVEWSPDSTKLAAGWGDGTIRVFDISGSELKKFISGSSTADDVSWSKDGSKLVSVNGQVKVWDYSTGSLLGSSENFQWLGDLEVSPDDIKIAVIGDDEILHTWDFASLIEAATTTTSATTTLAPTTATTLLPVPENLQNNTIEGMVTNAFTGQPIEDATVSILLDGQYYTTTKTDSSGRYSAHVPQYKTYGIFFYALLYSTPPDEMSGEFQRVIKVDRKLFPEKCKPIVFNGDPKDKLDVVFIGSNYSSSDDFELDAKSHTDAILSKEPFKSNINKINFFLLSDLQASECSYFLIGGGFICDDCSTHNIIDGQLVSQCTGKTVEVISQSTCPFDRVINLLNTRELAGKATDIFAVSPSNTPLVSVHEFGHTFGLRDEYIYSNENERQAYQLDWVVSSPNCDSSDSCSKWSEVGGSGCFKGCSFSDFYRSVENGVMRSIYDTAVFGPVNEIHIRNILDNYR